MDETTRLGERLTVLMDEHRLNIVAYTNGDQGCACGLRVGSHAAHVGQVLAQEAARWTSTGVDTRDVTGVTSVP